MSPTMEVYMKVVACVSGYSHFVDCQSSGIDRLFSVQVRLKSYIAVGAWRQTSARSHSEVSEAFRGSIAIDWTQDQVLQWPRSPCELWSPRSLKCFQSYREAPLGSLPPPSVQSLTTIFHECWVWVHLVRSHQSQVVPRFARLTPLQS